MVAAHVLQVVGESGEVEDAEITKAVPNLQRSVVQVDI